MMNIRCLHDVYELNAYTAAGRVCPPILKFVSENET
jgi:hypothetical protein